MECDYLNGWIKKKPNQNRSRRWNVTTSVVGLKKKPTRTVHIHQHLTQNGEAKRCSWEHRRRRSWFSAWTDWPSVSFTVTGWDSKLDLQLLPHVCNMWNCQSRSSLRYTLASALMLTDWLLFWTVISESVYCTGHLLNSNISLSNRLVIVLNSTKRVCLTDIVLNSKIS